MERGSIIIIFIDGPQPPGVPMAAPVGLFLEVEDSGKGEELVYSGHNYNTDTYICFKANY